MSTKDPNDKKVADLADYMPAPDHEEIEEVDLNFDFDGDDDGEDETPAPRRPKKDKDEGAGKADTGDEGEGDGEGDEAGDDKNGKGDEKDDADAGKDKAKADKPKKHMVPKERLDKVLARNRELEAELARKNAAATPAEAKDKKEVKAFDFDAAEDAYQDAILEGDKAKARQIRADMRAAERAEIKAEVSTETGTESQRDRINDAILQTTAEIERNFPILDSNSKEYDKEIAEEMIELYTGYVAAGKPALEALEKALKVTVKLHDLVEAADEDVPAKKDVKEKIAAGKKQPPKMPPSERGKKKDLDPDEIDVDNLTDEEWDAIPEAVKAKLRGDSF